MGINVFEEKQFERHKRRWIIVFWFREHIQTKNRSFAQNMIFNHNIYNYASILKAISLRLTTRGCPTDSYNESEWGGRGCAIAWQAKVSGANYHPLLFWDWTDHADDPLGMVSKICSWIPSCFQNFKYRTYWWRRTSKFPKKKLKINIIALNGYIKWLALIFLEPVNELI